MTISKKCNGCKSKKSIDQLIKHGKIIDCQEKEKQMDVAEIKDDMVRAKLIISMIVEVSKGNCEIVYWDKYKTNQDNVETVIGLIGEKICIYSRGKDNGEIKTNSKSLFSFQESIDFILRLFSVSSETQIHTKAIMLSEECKLLDFEYERELIQAEDIADKIMSGTHIYRVTKGKTTKEMVYDENHSEFKMSCNEIQIGEFVIPSMSGRFGYQLAVAKLHRVIHDCDKDLQQELVEIEN